MWLTWPRHLHLCSCEWDYLYITEKPHNSRLFRDWLPVYMWNTILKAIILFNAYSVFCVTLLLHTLPCDWSQLTLAELLPSGSIVYDYRIYEWIGPTLRVLCNPFGTSVPLIKGMVASNIGSFKLENRWFCDSKTPNIAFSPWRLSGPYCVAIVD